LLPNILTFARRALFKMLDFATPHLSPNRRYGHFGRNDLDLPWERTDKAAAAFVRKLVCKFY